MASNGHKRNRNRLLRERRRRSSEGNLSSRAFLFLVLFSLVVFFNAISTVNRHEIGQTHFEFELGSFKGTIKLEAAPETPAKEEQKVELSEGSSASERSKYAYAFLVGGARFGTTYFAGLSSVVAAVQRLRSVGSKADMVVMVQISAKTSHQKLLYFEEELLRRMNIKLVYLPKFANTILENFYSLMNEKFRILNMTEYSRVLYLDYDVLPLCNLDYLFELSDPLPSRDPAAFRLKENMVLSYRTEPAQGGFFMLKPSSADFDHIQQVILDFEKRGIEMEYPHWDPKIGWGQSITLPDYWRTAKQVVKQDWEFHGSFADQGLLYYWTKYVKKSVSIVVGTEVEQWEPENWDKGINGQLILRPREDGKITSVVEEPFRSYGCHIDTYMQFKFSPYKDFSHMTGPNKPWHKSIEYLEQGHDTIRSLWFNSLKDALTSTGLMDEYSWDTLFDNGGSIGASPMYNEIDKYLFEKQRRNWTQYEDEFPEP